MRILLSTHLYPTRDRRLTGDADALKAFADAWTRDGHEVTVLHAYMHQETGLRKLKLLLPRLRVSEENMDGARVLRAEMRFPRIVAGLRRAFMREAARLFAKRLTGEYDLLLAHFPVLTDGLAGALPVNCPKVAVWHTTDVLAARRQRLRMLDGAYAAFGFRSPRVERDARALLPVDVPSFLVYSGAPEVRHVPRERGETLEVLYAGKLIARKQPRLLLRACKRMTRPWRLTFVGDGPEREALALEAGGDERVRLLGARSHEDTLRAMERCEVMAMLSYGETFGLVYLEAMSRGAIPVGTRREGIDGVIADGENGFLLDKDDEAGLTRLLDGLAAMPREGRRALSEAALLTAERMNEREVARAYLRDALEASGKTV